MKQPVRHCRRCGGLNRRDTDSLVCNNCGKRVWDTIETVVRGVPRTADEPRLRWDSVEKTKTHFIVMIFFDSIVKQKKDGVSWFSIARLLTQSGHRCQEKTLQKHFLLEQGKRCGDGQAQKTKITA